MGAEDTKPRAHKSVAAELTICAMFTAVTAVLSQLSIPIGPVPISCSLIAVYLTGLLLAPKQAVLSQVAYLLLGAVGVPVFSNFGAGIAKLAGPTGGYLVVYPVLALFISLFMRVYDKKIAQKRMTQRALFLVGVLAMALVLCYLTGTLWFMLYAKSTFQKALTLTVLPFVMGDLLKIVLCVTITLSLRPQFLKAAQRHRS